MPQRATTGANQVHAVTEDAAPPRLPVTSAATKACVENRESSRPVRRVGLPRSCRKAPPPIKSNVPLLEPLAPTYTQPSDFQLVAYSAHAPVPRKPHSAECLLSESSSVGLRYRIMRKAVDARAKGNFVFSPQPSSADGTQHCNQKAEPEMNDAQKNVLRGHCPQDHGYEDQDTTAALCRNADAVGAAAPAPGQHLQACVCSICNLETTRADMIARMTHCKGCNKLCSQLRSRLGKVRFLRAAYQQLGSAATPTAVLELAARLVSAEEESTIPPGRAGLNGEKRNTGSAPLQTRTKAHNPPPCKLEVSEPGLLINQSMQRNSGLNGTQAIASKRPCPKSLVRGHRAIHRTLAQGTKIKTESDDVDEPKSSKKPVEQV